MRFASYKQGYSRRAKSNITTPNISTPVSLADRCPRPDAANNPGKRHQPEHALCVEWTIGQHQRHSDEWSDTREEEGFAWPSPLLQSRHRERREQRREKVHDYQRPSRRTVGESLVIRQQREQRVEWRRLKSAYYQHDER